MTSCGGEGVGPECLGLLDAHPVLGQGFRFVRTLNIDSRQGLHGPQLPDHDTLAPQLASADGHAHQGDHQDEGEVLDHGSAAVEVGHKAGE